MSETYDENSLLTRRKTLGIIGSGSIIPLAGCGDIGDDIIGGENGGEDATDSNGGEDGTGNGETGNETDPEDGDSFDASADPEPTIVDVSGFENISEHGDSEREVSVTVENSGGVGVIHFIFEYVTENGSVLASVAAQHIVEEERQTFTQEVYIIEGATDVNVSVHVGEYESPDDDSEPTPDQPQPVLVNFETSNGFDVGESGQMSVFVTVLNTGSEGDIHILMEQFDENDSVVEQTVKNVAIDAGATETYEMTTFVREETTFIDVEAGAGQRMVTNE